MALDLSKYGITFNAEDVKALEAQLNEMGKKGGVKKALDKIRNSTSADPLKLPKTLSIIVKNNKPMRMLDAAKEIEELNAAGKSAIEADIRQVQLPYWEAKYGKILQEEGYAFLGTAFTELLNFRSGKVAGTSSKRSESDNIIKQSRDYVVEQNGILEPMSNKDAIIKEQFDKIDAKNDLVGYYGASALFAVVYTYNGEDYIIHGKFKKTVKRPYAPVVTYPTLVSVIKADSTISTTYDPSVPEYKNFGHIIGDSTRPLLEDAAVVRALIADLKDPANSSKFDPTKYNKWLSAIGPLENTLNSSLIASIQHDLTFIHPNTKGKGLDTLAEYDRVLALAQASGVPEARMIGAWGGNSAPVDSKKVESELEWTIYTADPSEPGWFNQYRGNLPGTQKAYLDRGTKSLRQNLSQSLEAVVNSLTDILYDPSSSSMVTEATLKALAQILMPIIGVAESKKILRAIKIRSRKVIVDKTIKFKQPKLVKYDIVTHAHKILKAERNAYAKEVRLMHQKFRRAETARKSRLRAKAATASRRGKPEVDYNTIVSRINRQLREAVIAQMGPGSLVNRTGKFASSAKVTRASEKSLHFIYEKNPYGVFRTAGGDERVNHPRTRDPGKIIRAAIRSISKDNMSEYFKDSRLYIKED